MFLLLCQILTIKVWVSFWALYLVSLIYMSVCVPIPCCFDYYGLAGLVWYQVVWFLQLCSSFSKLLWVFGGFIWIFIIFVLFLWNTPLVSYLFFKITLFYFLILIYFINYAITVVPFSPLYSLQPCTSQNKFYDINCYLLYE